MADALIHVFLALVAVVLTGRLIGWLLSALRQPPVIGEVVAGILLGPSLLGRLAPDAYAFLLPPSIAPSLNAVAQLGVAVYMFVVGLELNLARLRSRARATVVVSNAGIIVPFVLGSVLALFLYPTLAPPDVPLRNFVLFMGVAMSITAFPVLARILADRGMTDSELGIVALTCAALDDVTAWCLLAVVVGVAQARIGAAVPVAAMTIAFIAFMLLVARRFVALWLRDLSASTVALAFGGMILSALVTERIGVHAIFGAFLFGAIVPHDSNVARTLVARLKTPVTILLLPAFFAYAGMRTRIDLLSTPSAWITCATIILVATAGKFGGCFLAARATGLDTRQAVGLGVLMNTRGLMELIVLNIGLDLGVITPALFTMMVLMALVTTMATTPVIDVLLQSAAKRVPRDRRAPL